MKEIILSGHVQGVACRYYCVENARFIGLRATATNLSNGTVRVMLDTDDDDRVRTFIRNLLENPTASGSGVRLRISKCASPQGAAQKIPPEAVRSVNREV
jgi:acylphosphatase